MSFHVPEQFRIESGPLASDSSYGNNGAFKYELKYNRVQLFVIASDGDGWEHVSVLNKLRAPTWDEMCMIKRMFWDEDDCVIQFHPPRKVYVNNHPFCLHLWRKIGFDFPLPDTSLIGINGCTKL